MTDKQPSELTVEECRAELAREINLGRLRALVGARRAMVALAEQKISGKLEGHVHEGIVKGWEYPQRIKA